MKFDSALPRIRHTPLPALYGTFLFLRLKFAEGQSILLSQTQFRAYLGPFPPSYLRKPRNDAFGPSFLSSLSCHSASNPPAFRIPLSGNFFFLLQFPTSMTEKGAFWGPSDSTRHSQQNLSSFHFRSGFLSTCLEVGCSLALSSNSRVLCLVISLLGPCSY